MAMTMKEWISNQPRLKGPTNSMLCHAECGLRPADLCEWHSKYSSILPPYVKLDQSSII